MLKKIANYFLVNYYIGTKLEVVNNKYTGKIIGNIVYGIEKVNYLNQFIKENNLNIRKIWAYGDHISGLELLKKADYSFAVNPDKNLRKEALKRNWQILYLRKQKI